MQGVVARWVNIDLLYTDKWNSTYNFLVAHLSPIKTGEHGHAPKILINSLQLLFFCWPKRLWAGLFDRAVSGLRYAGALFWLMSFPFHYFSWWRWVVGCSQVGGKKINYAFFPLPISFEIYLIIGFWVFFWIPYSHCSPLLTAQSVAVFKSCLFPVCAVMLGGMNCRKKNV